LAEHLVSLGRRPVIVSRGYGRIGDPDEPFIVSDGKNVFGMAYDSGDEPLLLARRLKQVPVVVCADRVRGVSRAIDALSADSVILDDGFQHFQLSRTMDIVCLNALNPWGAGVLVREGRDGLKRAQVAFVTRANLVAEERLLLIESEIHQSAPELSVVLMDESILFLNPATGRVESPDWAKGQRVMALSAIAGPAGFERSLQRAGLEIISSRRFPDHHLFRQRELDECLSVAQRENLLVVTTEKDFQRLPAQFPCLVAVLNFSPRKSNASDGAEEPWKQKIRSLFS